MRSVIVVVAAVVVILRAGAAGAQPDRAFTPLELAAGCAPPPTLEKAPDGAAHVIGSQDTVPRRLLGSRDLLVIDAGTNGGLNLGQQFYVRRASGSGMGANDTARGATTTGWIRVVAVNESSAIAVVDHACSGIIVGDYLEPFVAPALPPNADRDDRSGEPDFSSLARVVIGSETRRSGGIGDFMLIDRGSEQGVAAGTRVSFYRDIGVAGMPLTSIGDAVVVSAGGSVSVARITGARDAVIAGDYVAVRK